MPFNTILGATRIGPSSSDTFDPPSITTLADGSFVVSYDVIDYANDDQIVTDVFDAQGQLVQESFAKPLPHFAEDTPSVAGLVGGGYALAWTEFVFDPTGTFLVETIFTALYDSAGNQISAPVGVDTGTAQIAEAAPEVVALAGGGYVVTWLMREDAVSGTDDLMATIFDSNGQEIGPPINVSNSPGVNDSANIFTTSVAALPDGGFALTWTAGPFDDREVFTAIYDASGQQVLAPFNVTGTAGTDENLPQIAALTNGNYVLIWDEIGSFSTVHTAVFDAQGNEIAAPAAIGSGQLSHVVALTNGGYAVSWSDGDLFTAIYDSQGVLVPAPST